MGYVVTALPAYTEQDAASLIYQKLFTGSPVLDYIRTKGQLMTGVKSAETINIVSTRGVWQTQGCSLNPSGTTTFTQRTVTVGKPKIDMSWCERDLEPKYTQKKLAKGGNYDSLAYNTEIVDDTMQNAASDMATAVWQGNTASTDEFLNKFDGYIKIFQADIPGANTYSGVAWSETNSRTVMKGIAAKIVANKNVWQGGKGNVIAICSPEVKMAYAWKLVADNMFHIDANDPMQKLYIEGTNIEVVADPGLAGFNYIFGIEPEQFYGATDLENEKEKFDLWFSKDDQKLYFHTEWKFGVNVPFPERIYPYYGV